MDNSFKVVKIISEYEIVVNAGSAHGISRDDTLEIFVPGEDIQDPDTGESLGTLDTVKAYLNVKNVLSKMCVCTNDDSIVRNALESPFITHRTKRLNIDSSEISGGLTSRKIRIGDLVRKC